MKGDLLVKITEIIVGVVLGYITYTLSEPQGGLEGLLSVVVGLLSTLVVASLVEPFRLSREIKDVTHEVTGLATAIARAREEDASLIEVLQYSVATYPRELVPEVWLSFLWRVRSRYYSSSYISPDEGWDQAYTELGLEIQKTKIKVDGVDIRRVFIIDDKKELATLQSAMCQQKEAGINVKYIVKNDLEVRSMLRTVVESLETLDFALVDTRSVNLIIIDRNRRVQQGKISFRKEELEAYERLFKILFTEAIDIEC